MLIDRRQFAASALQRFFRTRIYSLLPTSHHKPASRSSTCPNFLHRSVQRAFRVSIISLVFNASPRLLRDHDWPRRWRAQDASCSDTFHFQLAAKASHRVGLALRSAQLQNRRQDQGECYIMVQMVHHRRLITRNLGFRRIHEPRNRRCGRSPTCYERRTSEAKTAG